MDLVTDSDQDALVATTAVWCRDNLPLDAARERSPGLWDEIDAMGWLGMTAPGMDLDHATEALVFAELGRHLAPIAALSTAVARRWCGTHGKVALAIAGERGTRVFDADGAAKALAWHDRAPGMASLPSPLVIRAGLDPTASLARLESSARFTSLEDRRAGLHLQLLAAAYAVGCAEAACDMAAAYAKVREQFGRPIGWFQALKHICADMAVRAAVARSQLCYAACALDGDDQDVAFHVAAAKRLADQAAIENARANIQVHGGIGMTDEAYPHLFLKRAHLLEFVAPGNLDVILGRGS